MTAKDSLANLLNCPLIFVLTTKSGMGVWDHPSFRCLNLDSASCRHCELCPRYGMAKVM
jgi:hypothetical protein